MINGCSARLALSLVLVATAPAASASARARAPDARAAAAAPRLLRSPGPSIDWIAIRDRTRQYEVESRAAALRGADPVLAPNARALLSRARSLLGEPPAGLARLSFPWAPTDAQGRDLAAAADVLAKLEVELASGVAGAREVLALERQRVASQAAVALRVDAEQRLLGVRAEEAMRLLAGARARLQQRLGGPGSRLLYWFAQLRGASAPALTTELARAFEEWGGNRPVLGAELTYVRGALKEQPLPSVQVTPAYASGDASFALEDTSVDREVERTPEIAARAAALGSPAAAYDFVKNEFRLDWYYGSLKGSGETFRERRGNDADLASVLIALLRSQGVAARYVRGTIDMPVGRLAGLMGLLSAAEVDAAAVDGFVPPVVRERVLAALPAAGIPFEPVLSGGAIRALRFVHTWVEAYLPYGEYRGRGPGKGPKSWVPLDPALPGGAKYSAVPSMVDALALTSLSASSLAQDYLESATSTSPLAFVRDRVGAALAAHGATYADALRAVVSRPEPLAFVPGALPYSVVAVHGEYAFLPEDAKHRLRFSVVDAAGAVVEHELPLHRVVGHRTVFAWEAATPVDAETIAAAGGLYFAPASSIQVVPVLRVDGVPQATGRRAFGLGAQASWRLELLLPDGSSRVIENKVVAGNVVAIGLGGPGNTYAEPADDPAGWRDGPAPRFLYARAAEYATRWTEAEEELARLLQIVPLRPTASVVLVENQLGVDEVLGVRRRILWKGLEVDADHRTMVPLQLVAGREKELLRLSGLQGSFVEAEVLRQSTGSEAVAAVSVIQEAHRRGETVLTITPQTAASDLARLTTTSEVRREVEDQAARGREVTIPAVDLTIRDWTGTGFIARDVATDEAGYFLSGVISGGQTVVSPGSWTDQALVDRLSRPDAPASITDTPGLPSKIARIVLLPGPVQEVAVGNTAPQPMTVVVTTKDGVPVQSATVRFHPVGSSHPRLRRGGSGGQGSTDPETVVQTDRYGRASVWVDPDTAITAQAIVRKGVPNEELIGLNQVMAETWAEGTPTIALPSPWTVLAHAGAPAHIRLPCSIAERLDGAQVYTNYCSVQHQAGLQIGSDIYAQVTDRYGNWVANTPVVWTSEPGGGRFIDFTRSPGDATRLLNSADAGQVETLTLWTTTDGRAVTDYIPGFTPRRIGIFSIETLTASAGAVKGRYAFENDVPTASQGGPATRFALRMRAGRDQDLAGIFGTTWQRPVGAEVFAWEGTRWRSIRGSDPIYSAEVQMDAFDATTVSSQRLLATQIVDPGFVPSQSSAGVWADFDDDRTAAFWPRYDVDGGVEHWKFRARVRIRGRTDVYDATENYLADAESRRPTFETVRLLPGWVETPTDEFGYAARDDVAVVFRVTNPAGYPIYARIVQEPRTSNEQIVSVPPPEVAPRHPTDPGLFLVREKYQSDAHGGSTISSFTLPINGHSEGGKVRMQLLVPNAKDGVLDELWYANRPVRIEPPGVSIVAADQALRATAVIVVRNFESSATPAAGNVGAENPTEPPVLIPAPVSFRVKGAGLLTVTMGGTEMAAANVEADQNGNATVFQVLRSRIGIARRDDGSIRAEIPPSDPTIHDVTIRHGARQVVIPFTTEVVDASPLPIGHTFVKDVSVVDGHVQKSATDISVPGRNGGLTFTRSYTSRGLEQVTSLGAGWTHSYRSFVTRDVSAGRIRYMVVGGEGGGQVFDCGMSNICKPQRGYHGTLRFDPPARPSDGPAIVYVARSGTEYRYTRRRTDERAQERVWLTSIVEPRGNETYLEYAGAEYEGELLRVFEPGNRRLLQFAYDWPGRSAHPLLRSVSLLANPSGTRAAPEQGFPAIDPRGVCVAFTQDAIQNLSQVTRFDGPCRDGVPVLRTERYGYQGGWNRALRSNLTSYTDPNGRTTTYAYYGPGSGAPAVPGTASYLYLAELEERVWQVTEPSPGGTTSFEYSLVPNQHAVLGQVRPLFQTVVRPARPGSDPTTYLLDSYGASSKVIRGGSTRSTLWDPVHIRPVVETDPRGRTVKMTYDERGNLIARRTATTALNADGPVPATEPLVDGSGKVVPEIVERWSYDPNYGGETCRMDAQGRVTRTTYTLGLPIDRREYATPTDAFVATDSCDEASASVSSSDRDHWLTSRYCGIGAAPPCDGTLNAVKGDLVQTLEGSRLVPGRGSGSRATTISAYDAFGQAQEIRVAMDGGVDRVTTRLHDARGRLTSESDSLGHSLVRTYDGLMEATRRVNSRGGSPGEYREVHYWPGGQVRSESLGASEDPATLRWSRSIDLDGLNLPETVTETVATAVGTAAFTSVTRHDQAGNAWQTVDRRGVRKTTTFDALDRPATVTVDVEDEALFTASGGLLPTPNWSRTIGPITYDAAGNKVSETDVHGHTTTFVLDPLYRTVAVVAPPAPRGFLGTGSGTAQWVVQRRYDLVGNKVREVENTTLGDAGGGAVTTWSFDFANRVTETVDPVGRFERRSYDGLGELDSVTKGFRPAQGSETVSYESATKGYDAAGRTTGNTETFADLAGSRTVETAVSWDDSNRTVYERDRRGAVSRRRLDDLDRVFEETLDVGTAPLARGRTLPPALELTSSYGYDAAGHRTRLVDPLGRTTEEVYDGLGRLEQRRLPMDVTESTAFDGEGNAIRRVDRRGVTVKSWFDPLGREARRALVESLSGGGGELTVMSRQFTDKADGDGLTSSIEIDARGNATTRFLDALHREVKTTDAAGRIALAWYDAKQRRGAQDPKGYVTEFDQDAVGRPTAQRDRRNLGAAAAWTQSWVYDDAALTERWTDRGGIVSVTTRDGIGQARQVTRGVVPQQTVQTTSYDAGGNVTRIDDPNGHATTFVYDGAGRKTSETRASGTAVASTTTYGYDAAGNRITTKGPRGSWAFDVRVTFDDLNRPVRTESPTGDPSQPFAVTSRAFDEIGNTLCERRPLGGDPLAAGAAGLTVRQVAQAVCPGEWPAAVGHGMRYRYDELSKLTSVIDAAGGEHSYVYDEARNLVAKQDANGNLTVYAYDALSRRTDEWQHLDPHARLRTRGEVAAVSDNGFGNAAAGTGAFAWHVGYDANGNPEKRTDPRGVTISSTFGLLNRLEAVSYPDDPGLRPSYPYPVSTVYQYGGNGNVELVTEVKRFDPVTVTTQVTDPAYDALGRLETETRYDGKVVAFEYDAKGNRTKVTDPDRVATSYGYDEQDRLMTVTTPLGEATYRYWPDGLLKGSSLPSGLEEARCYDPAGRVTAILTATAAIGETCPNVAGMVSRFDYAYDANGNRTQQLERRSDPISSSIGAAEETRYGYDELDRLVGVAYPDRTVLYHLDAVGNRTGERVAPASGTLALTVASYAGAATGLTSDLTATFNRVDWLTSQTDAVDATRTATYGYDNAGNLTDKVRNGTVRQLRWSYRNTLTAVLQGAGATQLASVGTYDYDANLQRVSRTTVSGQVEYVLDDRHVLQEARGAAGHPSYRRYHYGSGPLLVEDGSNRRFISTDALGSTTDLTTTGATVASMRKYDAWGQYRNDTAPLANEPKLGFTGHQYDPETGLVYARARYYDPDIGRFISRDSFEGDIGNAPSLHRYTYGHGNPTRYTDPSGLAAAEDISAQAAQEAAEEAARKAAAEAVKKAAEGAAANMPMPSILSRLLAVGAKVVRVGGVLIQIAWPERTAVYECENSPGGCVGPATRPGDAVATTEVRLPQAGPTPPGGKEHRIKQDDGVSPVQGGPVAQGDSGGGEPSSTDEGSEFTKAESPPAGGKESKRRTLDERVRDFVRDQVAPEFDEPFEYVIHGTTDEKAQTWNPLSGRSLFTAVNPATAELFARRTVEKEGGTPGGVVVALPRAQMERLRRQGLVQTRQVPDMPGRFETVFQPGAVETIKAQGVIQPLPQGMLGP